MLNGVKSSFAMRKRTLSCSKGCAIRRGTEADFQNAVIDRSREVPVVVDFWAEWCGPCRALTPALERAAGEREGKVELVKVDVDGNPGLAQAYGVQGIPAVKAFKDGEVVDEFVGAQPAPVVEKFMDRLVPSEADALVSEGDEDSLRRALELEPGRADAAVSLAHTLMDRGEYDEAAQGAGERQRRLRGRRPVGAGRSASARIPTGRWAQLPTRSLKGDTEAGATLA